MGNGGRKDKKKDFLTPNYDTLREEKRKI